MATVLLNNMRAAFNTDKSDVVANTLIERALNGLYEGSREIGPKGEAGDQHIIGTLYLMAGDENTYNLAPGVEAFVLRIEHEARLVDYFTFPDIDAARLFMTVKSERVTAVDDTSGLRSNN